MEKDKRIRVIETEKNLFELPAKTRVCAYVRVSTIHEGQRNSMDNQEEYFVRMLSQNPAYEFIGVFSDFGIPGSKESRPGFDAMIKKAREGELDLVFTKSISRFARNTLMLLSTVRELAALGVGVYFEEQNINTLNKEGELLLAVLAGIAEEERKSVSQNIRQANQHRYKSGKPYPSAKLPYGYLKGKNKELIINEEQAAVIRRIFDMYIGGMSACRIEKILNEEKVPTLTDEPWFSHRILRIISNEKYAGDILMQKSYIGDTGKQIINKGQRPKYLLHDSHPAIVPREIWEQAVERRKKRMPKIYPFTRLLLCHRCGAVLTRHMQAGGNISWVCSTYLVKGIANCEGARITESVLLALTKGMKIEEKMVLMEVGNLGKRYTKTKANYRLIPAAEYFKGKG